MAVAHDAVSESHAGTTGSASQASFSWSHDPVGTPAGVIVFVFTISATKKVTSVTYDGEALVDQTALAAVDSAGEPGRVDVFFLSGGINATDPSTIVVNRTNDATVMYAVAVTVTAARDVGLVGGVLLQGDGTLAEQAVTDGNPGSNSIRYAATYYGGDAVPSAGASSTLLADIDLGLFGCSVVRETTAGQGSRNVGFTGVSDDRAAVHVAAAEWVARTSQVPVESVITPTDVLARISQLAVEVVILEDATWVPKVMVI